MEIGEKPKSGRKAPHQASKTKKKEAQLKLGTWNVRTMCTGFDNTEFDETNDLRKTATIDRVLMRLNVDIVALQETRLADAGSVRGTNFVFFW